ncbi:hypothetical protein [Parendozoicomonas haliclonae]|uniref:Uncharacterized protein n=2 Tax=Parendozoicomonas haliclonae TaxID=1960125 RepID=A0A1X7AS78_9GAMM|nr:hypothetical protein [Parendozoicomonas haliclonae]SMA50930.1 hypothetical protein EHSB41UT_04748 [Parendozoicomonas haliclonae]
MSGIGDKIGEKLPNLKNLHNVVLSKLAHNNITGQIKYAWRGFKASVQDAVQTFVHKFQDSRMHVTRLNSREVQLLKMARGEEVTEAELSKAFNRGDSQKAQQDAVVWMDGFKKGSEMMPDLAVKAAARHQDELAGHTAAQKELERLTTLDNLKVIQAEKKFAQHHPHWRKDWDRHLIVVGEQGKGVDGVAKHFKDEFAKAGEGGQKLGAEQYDEILYNALESNLDQLKNYQARLTAEVEEHLEAAQRGTPIQTERLKALQHEAAFDAIEYIEKCLQPTEAGKAMRASLISKYSSAFGLETSINRDIEVTPDRQEFNEKLEKLMQDLQKKPD